MNQHINKYKKNLKSIIFLFKNNNGYNSSRMVRIKTLAKYLNLQRELTTHAKKNFDFKSKMRNNKVIIIS